MKKANKETIAKTYRSYTMDTIRRFMDADEKRAWDLALPWYCEIMDGVVLKMIRAGVPFDSVLPL